jgi:hypothetical protein
MGGRAEMPRVMSPEIAAAVAPERGCASSLTRTRVDWRFQDIGLLFSPGWEIGGDEEGQE